jgi:transcriptional pleiotropic repressor
MLKNLLEKTRKLNLILQDRGDEKVSFNELCDTIAEILQVNVYVINAKGKILGSKMVDTNTSSILADPESGEMFFSEEHNQNMLKITETVPNLTEEQIETTFKGDTESYTKHVSIVPIKSKGQRIGTFVLARLGDEFGDTDVILAENAATVVSMEITRARKMKKADLERRKSVVKMAIESLSFSELEAIEHIFNELEGTEGLLVASKVADRVGITRSVIVNALRKFESAGVIESRSLGMKGTHIRILNNELMPELAAMKKRY